MGRPGAGHTERWHCGDVCGHPPCLLPENLVGGTAESSSLLCEVLRLLLGRPVKVGVLQVPGGSFWMLGLSEVGSLEEALWWDTEALLPLETPLLCTSETIL